MLNLVKTDCLLLHSSVQQTFKYLQVLILAVCLLMLSA